MSARPLLVVDGDSLAHRAFHALPSSIRDGAGRPANMIVGFGNMLVTVWESVQPRATIVGWDTLTVPTYRHEAFAPYQSGRVFPPELTEQLDRLPELVGAMGFAWAKAPGYEADDFLGAAVASKEAKRGETIVLTTTDADGESHERVLSPIDYDGQLFVAANHWPRAWYHRALENPEVSVTRNGETTDYRAVPVSEEERKRLLDESGFPLVAYVFTGFAPRQFLRLDPR